MGMNHHHTIRIARLLVASALSLSPAFAAQKQSNPEAVPLSEAGVKLEAKYAATLNALQKDIATALPKLGEQQQSFFLKSYQAEAAAQASLLRRLGESLDEELNHGIEMDLDAWREFASQVGVSPVVAASIAAKIPAEDEVASWGFQDLLDFALGELSRQLFALVSPGNSGLARILPQARVRWNGVYEFAETYEEWETRCRAILPVLLNAWMSGVPVLNIGETIHTYRNADGRVNMVHLGRRFALHLASSLAHGVSVVVRVLRDVRYTAVPVELRAQLPLASGCVREGFDDPDKLLLFWYLRRYGGIYPRVVVHDRFRGIRDYLPGWTDLGDVDGRRGLIRRLWDSR